MRRIFILDKYKNNKGFTLVELLAVLAILSIVTTIGIYIGVNVINTAKRRGYVATSSNIENVASEYIMEKFSSSVWTKVASSNLEYQCVSVQNLMDAGYFKSDVLDSYISDNRKVLATDNVYLERDITSKTIVKKLLILNSSYNGICGNIKTTGDIYFDVNPSGWSKSKNISIKYRLHNALYVTDYSYSHSFDTISSLKSFDSSEGNSSLSVTKNGNLYASIKDKDGNAIISSTLNIDKIDIDNPRGEIISENNVSNKQKVTLSMIDDESGVSKYYFGKQNPGKVNVDWVEISPLNNKEVFSEVTSSGTWYLGIQDVVGNMTVVSKKFYKTTLIISNASVSPKEIITMDGNSFLIPSVIANSGYIFKGWYNNSSYSGSAITTYKPTSDSNLYGKVNEDIKHSVIIKYHVNGGGITPTTDGFNSWSTDNGLVLKNGSLLITQITYNNNLGANGLVDWDNPDYLKIFRNGYTAKNNYEWVCLSDECVGKEFSDNSKYKASDFCDASSSDCEVVLGVNWVDKTPPTIEFGTNGSNGKWIKTASTKITVTDAGSGVDTDSLEFTFRASATAPTISYAGYKPFTNGDSVEKTNGDGIYYLHVYACDKAGNCTYKTSNQFKLDNTPPVVICERSVDKIAHYNMDTGISEYEQEIIDRGEGNKCEAFSFIRFKHTNYKAFACELFLSASDNNGITSTSCSRNYYDDDGDDSTICKESDGTTCEFKATYCNCLDGDCRQVLTYTVKDEAGNVGKSNFTIYHRYMASYGRTKDYYIANYCPADPSTLKTRT